jgi:hypothetical protein
MRIAVLPHDLPEGWSFQYWGELNSCPGNQDYRLRLLQDRPRNLGTRNSRTTFGLRRPKVRSLRETSERSGGTLA